MMNFVEEMFSLKDRVAVVIGGSGVLGGSMARALAQAGARTAVGYAHNEKGARDCVDAIRALGAEAMVVQADSSSKASLESALRAVLTAWNQVDILVNAPGTNSTTPVLEIEEEEWQRILDTNLKGVFLACQVFGKHLIEQKRSGSIINISSVSSERPLSRVFTYSVSKAGLNNLTRFLAREWAPFRIRVNAIMPGFFPAAQNRAILTDERRNAIFQHTPMARYGEPHELSGALIWLASEKASSFVTGAIVPVDGGFTAMTI